MDAGHCALHNLAVGEIFRRSFSEPPGDAAGREERGGRESGAVFFARRGRRIHRGRQHDRGGGGAQGRVEFAEAENPRGGEGDQQVVQAAKLTGFHHCAQGGDGERHRENLAAIQWRGRIRAGARG